jgi:hypothetical protein
MHEWFIEVSKLVSELSAVQNLVYSLKLKNINLNNFTITLAILRKLFI